jgi:FSR family fosmidomycin resistance protein-like MFS transporter
VLGAGHVSIDMSVGAIPAFLPLLTATFALSDLAAAMVLGASTLASSAVQPLFGLLSDRRPSSAVLWGGAAVAAGGLAAMGLAGGYAWVIAAVVGSGLGVAAFHPEAARTATRLSGTNRATGVGWFILGGNLGFALGPLLAGLFIPLMGLRATLVFLVPGALACAALLAFRSSVTPPPEPTPAPGATRESSRPAAVALLVGAVTLRTWTQFGVLAIGALYLARDRGLSDRATALALFAFAMAGALGTVAGGMLADRVGYRRMVITTTPVTGLFIALFLLTDGAVSIAALACAGALVLSSLSVTVVMGQDYLPGRPALAAGLMIGFAAIGSAAPGLALLGLVADAAGPQTALWLVAVLPVLAGGLAVALPRTRHG